MKNYFIFSQDQEIPVEFYQKFDKDRIKTAIIKHLSDNPEDVIELCREYDNNDPKRFYGMEIISFFQMNKKGQVCKVILKGEREFLKPLKY